MTSNLRLVSVVFAFACEVLGFSTPRLIAQVAHVTDGQSEGQGVLLKNGQGQCMALVPNHIINAPSELRATLGPGQQTTATIPQVYRAQDLALLLLAQKEWLKCAELTAPAQLQSLLDQPRVTGVIVQRDDLGQLHRIEVSVETSDQVYVRLVPVHNEVLAEGLSGSAFYLSDNNFGGIVDSVLLQSNKAIALRSDHALAVVSGFVQRGAIRHCWCNDSLSEADVAPYFATPTGDYRQDFGSGRVRVVNGTRGYEFQGTLVSGDGYSSDLGFLRVPVGRTFFTAAEKVGSLQRVDAQNWYQEYRFSVTYFPDPAEEDERKCKPTIVDGATGHLSVERVDSLILRHTIYVSVPSRYFFPDGRRCTLNESSSSDSHIKVSLEKPFRVR